MQTPPAGRAGLLILLTIIVITTNLRLIVENILKYGVLTRPQAWVLAALPRQSPLLLLSWPAMAASIVVAWAIENIGANRLRSERKVRRQPPSAGAQATLVLLRSCSLLAGQRFPYGTHGSRSAWAVFTRPLMRSALTRRHCA